MNPPGPLYGWVFTLGRGALGGGLCGLGGRGTLGAGSGGESSITLPFSSTGGGGVTGSRVGAGGCGGPVSGVVGGRGSTGAGGSRGVSGVRSTTLSVTMGEFVIGSSVGLPEGFGVGLLVGEMRPVSTLRLVGISVVAIPFR